jgi:hypothetical protein
MTDLITSSYHRRANFRLRRRYTWICSALEVFVTHCHLQHDQIVSQFDPKQVSQLKLSQW